MHARLPQVLTAHRERVSVVSQHSGGPAIKPTLSLAAAAVRRLPLRAAHFEPELALALRSTDEPAHANPTPVAKGGHRAEKTASSTSVAAFL